MKRCLCLIVLAGSACAAELTRRPVGMDASNPEAPEAAAPAASTALAPEPSPADAPVAPAQPEAVYTCPMHPDVKQSKPGRCPQCGMNLAPAHPPGAHEHGGHH